MSNDTVVLLGRIEKLERQNRWMKLGGLVILLGIFSISFYGAKTSKKVIEANEFRLIDENGKVRGRFGFFHPSEKEYEAPFASPRLELYDRTGKVRGEFVVIEGLGDDYPNLDIFYEKDKGGAISIGMAPHAEGHISVRDKNGSTLFYAP